MRLERGFRRLTAIVSLVLAMLGFVFLLGLPASPRVVECDRATTDEDRALLTEARGRGLVVCATDSEALSRVATTRRGVFTFTAGAVVLGAGAPWLIFFAVRWIAYGFVATATVCLLAVLLAGCASPVTLRHPDGRSVQCRVMPLTPFHDRGCIYDFQRQGFERVPE